MLALDHGGSCEGIVQRLPPDAVEANLDKLLRREIVTRPSPFPPRWVDVETASGAVRAITFAMDRKSDFYVTGLSVEEIADVLAVAVGHFGSMAEYLHNTVRHLQELGIDDRYLWRLQELVAERIEAASEGRSSKPPRHPRTRLPRMLPTWVSHMAGTSMPRLMQLCAVADWASGPSARAMVERSPARLSCE